MATQTRTRSTAPTPTNHWFDRPIFVVSCNRSGSTLLFRTLSGHPDVWSLYVEGKDLFHSYFPVDDEAGDRIDEIPSSRVVGALCQELYSGVHNKEHFQDDRLGPLLRPKLMQRPFGQLYKEAPLRLVEKTPSNCFRIPFLARAFPRAKFVFLLRRGEAVVSSLMEGWKRWSGVGDGGAWTFDEWHYLVPPGWREWTGRPLEEICAFQWIISNRMARRDLELHAPDRTLQVRFEDLLSEPRFWFDRVRAFCELPPSSHFDRLAARIDDRVFTTGGSAPRKEKWRDLHEKEIDSVRSMLTPLLNRFYPDGPR